MADEKSTIMADETDKQIADGLTGDKDGWMLDELINQMCPDGVEWKPLSEVGTFSRGSSFQKKDFVPDGFPCIHYGQVHTTFDLYTDHVVSYLPVERAQKMRKAVSGDIIMATTSEDDEAVGKSIAWLGENDVVVSNDAYIFHHTLDPRYAAHLFASEVFKRQKQGRITGTKVKRIHADAMNGFLVPVPPLDVQRRIAHILDLLSELTSELTSEREARQSQYEWYRNHLLDKDTLTGGEGGGWQSLADLIEAQCPDGVEYRPITELVRLNAHKQLGASALEALVSDDGNIPLLPSSKNYDWMTTEELAGDAICEGNVIAMGRARYANMKYCSGKFVSANNVLIESIDENVLDARFLYHFLSTHSADCYSESGTYPKFDRILFEKLQVPVPPLDVQLLIVDLLDKLDDYAVRIDGVLPREITTSQQRYEWWRDRLLDFRDVRGGGRA